MRLVAEMGERKPVPEHWDFDAARALTVYPINQSNHLRALPRACEKRSQNAFESRQAEPVSTVQRMTNPGLLTAAPAGRAAIVPVCRTLDSHILVNDLDQIGRLC